MAPCRSVDQLCINPNLIPGAAYAAFQHVAHPQLLGHLPDLYLPTLVGKR